MLLPRNFSRLAFAGIFLSAAMIISGCTDGMDRSDLRVVHAVKDAPPVNVRLNSKKVIKDLDYANSSGYESVRSGVKKITVEAIVPGGNLDVIEVDNFDFESGQRYNIFAINDTAAIAPLVVEESSADPHIDEVAIAVVHASTNAGLVDVYVTAPNIPLASVDPNFSFDFSDVVDAGALPAGTYQIRVTLNGSKDAVFDSGPVDLSGFGGEKLLIAAISSTSDTELAESPIKLLVATDIAQVTLLDIDTQIGARVVHLSPDAGTAAGGPVEVFAESPSLGGEVELIDAFAYTDIVPAADSYVNVPAGDYTFKVAPNTDTSGDAVYTSPAPLTLEAGQEYTVIAAGYVLTAPAFDLLATGDNNRPIVTQVSVKVVHGAPAAGIVDVYVTPAGAFTVAEIEADMAGAPLLEGFAFGDITDYVAVPPGSYDIRVVPQASGTVAINVEAFPLNAGTVATVIAREPIDVGLPDDFGLVVLTN